MAGKEEERPVQQTQSKEQAKTQQGSLEHEPLPSVWNVLERKVKVDERNVGLDHRSVPESFRDLREAQEYYNELHEVSLLEYELWKKGTVHDKLTLALFDSITLQLGSGDPNYRYLTQEEFQHVRTQAESLPNEELANAIREQNKYYKQLGKERGVLELPEQGSGVFECPSVAWMMPSPEEVDRRLVAGQITEEEAREQKKNAIGRMRTYQEDARVQSMHEKGLLTEKECQQLGGRLLSIF